MTTRLDERLRDSLRGSAELEDWLESLEEARRLHGPEWTAALLAQLQLAAHRRGVPVGPLTPYVNTIPPELEAPHPGDPELEERIEALVR